MTGGFEDSSAMLRNYKEQSGFKAKIHLEAP